jgi:hypothetical protein
MSDEADRIRTYQELTRRGQPVPGKNFGTGVTPKTKRIEPKIKVIDTTKMKQLKLLRKGGEADPLKGLAKMITDFEKGKTGIKTVDRQKKKDAAMIKKLKKSAKVSRVKARPQTFSIAPNPKKDPFSVQQKTIMMASEGGVVDMTRSKMVNPETGE